MRHLKQKRRLEVTSSHRKAMLANLAKSLVENERIKTTEARAKELRRVVEKLVSIAKCDNLNSRRQIYKTIQDRSIIKKLFNDLAPRFKDRNGGYTRIFKLGRRSGDCAPISLIEFLPAITNKEKKEASPKKDS